MKIVNASCKFCGKPLALRIDPSYDEIGDEFKLIRLAACNRCADLRVNRRRLGEAILKLALSLIANKQPGHLDAARKGLSTLTLKYADLITDWTKTPCVWEPAIVEAIISEPTQVGDVISRMWPNKTPART